MLHHQGQIKKIEEKRIWNNVLQPKKLASHMNCHLQCFGQTNRKVDDEIYAWRINLRSPVLSIAFVRFNVGLEQRAQHVQQVHKTHHRVLFAHGAQTGPGLSATGKKYGEIESTTNNKLAPNPIKQKWQEGYTTKTNRHTRQSFNCYQKTAHGEYAYAESIRTSRFCPRGTM